MAYDPETGKYTEEDDSVSKRMTGLLSGDSLYMKQAEAAGERAAHSRGLLNSSMGVQSAQASRVAAALPIASQEAGQAHERGMQGRDIQIRDIGQKRDIDNSRYLQEQDIGSREKMQRADISSQHYMQGKDISSQQYMQGRDIGAAHQRLVLELGSRENLQLAEAAAAKERLGLELDSRERTALQELQAAEQRLGMELDSREGMQSEGIAADTRIAQMNISANAKRDVAALAQAYEATYSQTVASIMSNPDIPAAERQRYLDHAAKVRDSNLNLVEQFYGIELKWNTAGTGNQPKASQQGTNSTTPKPSAPGSPGAGGPSTKRNASIR